MSIKPLADRVVAKKDAAVDKTASGILLGTSEEKSNTAVIETVKAGERFIYREYTATEVKVNGEEYLIVKEEDILAVIK